jgi:hypothetical protein
MATEYRVAIALVADHVCRAEVILHAKLLGDDAWLVHPIRAPPSDIELLQRDDIRLVLREDPGDARRVHPAVHPSTVADVVGDETSPRHALSQ